MLNVYHMYVDVPKKVRIVSKKMNIDKTFYPNSAESNEDIFSYEDLKQASESPLFDYVAFQPITNSVYSVCYTEAGGELWKLEEDRWFNAKECEFINIDKKEK